MSLRWAVFAASMLASAGAFAQMQPTSDMGIPMIMRGGFSTGLLPTDPQLKPLRQNLCHGAHCRHGISVHLKMPNGPDYVVENSYGGPTVFRGAIFIFPGETMSIEADPEAGGPTDLHYVDSVEHPDRTLTLAFEQAADGGMRLTVTNPFGKALKFNALTLEPSGASDYHANICAVPAHGSRQQKWPFPVWQAVVAKLAFVPDAEADACAP